VETYMNSWANNPSINEQSVRFSDEKHQDEDIKWVVLDFTQVTGIDTTAANNCFLTVRHIFRSAGVTVVFTGLNEEIHDMLGRTGVLCNDEKVFARLEDGLEWCEERLLESFAHFHPDSKYVMNAKDLRKASSKAITNPSSFMAKPNENPEVLRDILEDYLELENFKLTTEMSSVISAERLAKFFVFEHVETGHVFWNEEDAPDKVYFVQDGAIEQQIGFEEGSNNPPHRFYKVSAGGIVGESGFFLREPYATRAVALTPTSVWWLDRSAMSRMQAESPSLCILVQQTCIKTLALTFSNRVRMTKTQILMQNSTNRKKK